MLVVRGRKAIRYAPVYEVSKVEDGTPSFEDNFRQNRDSLAELLGSERALGPSLVYLKDTERGSRGGAVEKNDGVEAKK